MEKLFKVLGIVVLALVVLIGLGTIVQAAASGGIFPLKNGWSFGAANDSITFFGGTPVARQSLTNATAVLKSFVATDGTTNTVAFLTGTNQVNQIVATLRNLNLAQ